MFALLAAGCVEYDIGKPLEPESTDTPTESTTPDTEPTVDTGTPVVDTGTVPAAEEPVYANTSTDLFVIDPATGDRQRVGAFHLGTTPIAQMVDIAIDLDGRMYGGTYDALYQIDPRSAAVSKVCDSTVRFYALAFSSDGVLFAGAGPDVVQVDPLSCEVRPLATNGGWETSGDLVGLPDGFLYWTVRGEPTDQLVRVDPITGATFWVGEVAEEKLFGLGYHDDQLYGFSDLGAIVRIDPMNADTQVVSADGTAWWGATTNPVLW
jgi:hypothetical protein